MLRRANCGIGNTLDKIKAFMAYDAMLGFRTYRLENNLNPRDYKAENK
jgi:hypothetical protein